MIGIWLLGKFSFGVGVRHGWEPIARIAYTYPLGMSVEGSPELLIRDVVIANEKGEITCAAEISEGSEIRLILGDPDKAIQSATEAAEGTLSQLKRRAKPKKELPKIQMDEEKIKLAINNLLDNAIRYTLPGGRMKIGLSYGIKGIECKIQDTGVGIPKNQQERVFSRFFRGSNITKMETERTGLGLFITKNIIEAHGGKIWFESKENKGTTFYFTLPIA